MKLSKSLAALALMGGLVPGVSSAIVVDGVTFNQGSTFVFGGNIYESKPLNVGEELKGYGLVTGIDSLTNTGASDFYAGGELTFSFSGFTLTSVGNVDGVAKPDFIFSGGVINFYTDASEDFNPATPGTAADGNLWLSLKADTYTDTTTGQVGTLQSYNTNVAGNPLIPSNGQAYFSVIGGAAAAYLDTNTILGSLTEVLANPADFFFTSSYQQAGLPANAGYPIQGNGTLQGFGNTVPEPESLALLAVGLLAAGATSKRRKAA